MPYFPFLCFSSFHLCINLFLLATEPYEAGFIYENKELVPFLWLVEDISKCNLMALNSAIIDISDDVKRYVSNGKYLRLITFPSKMC